MIDKSFWAAFVILAIVLTFICVGLAGCAYTPKDNIFIGWGEAERDAEGNVTKIKSSPPIEIVPGRY